MQTDIKTIQNESTLHSCLLGVLKTNLIFSIFRQRVALATNSLSLEIVYLVVAIVVLVTHFKFCKRKEGKKRHFVAVAYVVS